MAAKQENTLFRSRWEMADEVKLVKLAQKQLKKRGFTDFQELSEYFNGRSPEAIKLKMSKMGLKVVKMPVVDPKTYTPEAGGIKMEERVARHAIDPVRASKWVLGARLDVRTMMLDGKKATIDVIVKEANRINKGLGAEQIGNKKEWIVN